MDVFTELWEVVDSFLISPYRWPENPLVGWWVGTLLLALWATLAGEITMALVFRANREPLRLAVQEMAEHHSQSIHALQAGNKQAYKDINRLANESYGKTFFLQVAMAASSLWPAACALAWMQTRFSEIRFPLPADLPLVGESVGYPFLFIPLYILTRILVAALRRQWRRSAGRE